MINLEKGDYLTGVARLGENADEKIRKGFIKDNDEDSNDGNEAPEESEAPEEPETPEADG